MKVLLFILCGFALSAQTDYEVVGNVLRETQVVDSLTTSVTTVTYPTAQAAQAALNKREKRHFFRLKDERQQITEEIKRLTKRRNKIIAKINQIKSKYEN
jgi:hypothetical protein